MKNEIKKIIIEVNGNNLNKLVVIKNNTVEFYNANNLSKDELLCIYSYNVRELKKKYNQNIEGLSHQESVNKLFTMGLIEHTKKKLITNIQIVNQGELDERIIISYEDRKEEVKLSEYKDRKEYQNIKENKILELCHDYHIKYKDLLRLGLLKVENKIEKVLKENKIKNFVIHNKRLISSILIGAITVTGIGIGISKFKRKDNLGLEVKPTKEIVNTIELNPSIIPKATKEVTVTPTIKITSTPYISATPKPTIVNEVDIKDRIPQMDQLSPAITKEPVEMDVKENLHIIKSKLLDFKEYLENYLENNEIQIEKVNNNQGYYGIFNQISQKNQILEKYKSNVNPFKTRFSQGSSGYGNVKFEGKTIKRSGCGICAFASGISCALTLEYNTNISVNPKELLKELKDLPNRHYYRGENGLNWGKEFSYISEDITESFQDISIIEFVGQIPTFNTETLEMITNNYPVVVSLNGRSHVVCVAKNNGNGKFYVLDPDRGYSSPVGIKTYIVRSDGKRKGTISGKKAWIMIPNKNITINGNEIKIKGLDLTKLPKIGRFETNGTSYEVEINENNNSLIVNVPNKEEGIGIKR